MSDPNIPMTPESLPQQRLRLVVDLPPFPVGFEVNHVHAGAASEAASRLELDAGHFRRCTPAPPPTCSRPSGRRARHTTGSTPTRSRQTGPAATGCSGAGHSTMWGRGGAGRVR